MVVRDILHRIFIQIELQRQISIFGLTSEIDPKNKVFKMIRGHKLKI